MSSANNNKKKYEVINHISDNGDFIYAAPIEEIPDGQTYYSLEAIRDIINEELDRRFGPWVNNNEDVSE